MTEQQPIRLERRDNVAILTIDRPAKRNALSRATLRAFAEIGKALEADESIRVIVVTGAGDKAFCAGADLKERIGMDENAVRDQVKMYRRAWTWIDTSPVPVVAAINGVALGGGLEIALCCDLRVAAAHAALGLPEVTLGIIPGAGGTQRLPRLIGEARAKELILFGRPVTADQALDIGLVNRVTQPGTSVLEDTLEWIRPLARGAPIALRAALEAIDASFEVPLRRGMDLERVHYDECLRSADRIEALKAFAEKRVAKFDGR